jgi:hypothetical protein
MDLPWLEDEETIAWYRLTPAERFQEFLKLWEVYILLGGDLGPEPDSQSPFSFFEASG